MNNHIEVTLIIPNYNNSRFLRQCVESAVNQTYPLKEIIIVDDKSTDDSVALIHRLEREYPSVRGVFQDKNGGVSKARNRGLEEAHTEYVTYMDADDFYYNPAKIENEVKMIEKYREKNRNILAYSVVAHCENDGTIKKTWSYYHYPKIQFIEGNALNQLISLKKQRRIPRDYVIRKDLLEAAGAYSFYKNLFEDLDLLLRIAMQNVPFYCTYEFGTCYRKSIGGLSKKSPKELNGTLNEIAEIYYKKLSLKNKCKVQGWKLWGNIINLPFEVKDWIRKRR